MIEKNENLYAKRDNKLLEREDGEEYIPEIVKAIQANDLENKRENMKPK